MRRRWKTWMTSCMVALMPMTAARADHQIDWDEWYGGNVDVRVALKRGEGASLLPGEPVRIEFETNESAYHLAYAIDTDGAVRLLYPRYWEDDGWVEAGRKVKLRSEDLAWPANRWGSSGIVYVEVVASPTPFDFYNAGLVREANACAWYDDDDLLRVSGDPFLGFNTVHRRLFPDWDNAAFAVDYTYFYVGGYYEAPRYLGYRYSRVYVRPPHSGFRVGVRFGWSWEFGYGYCRPVYARYYVPGVHYVHHRVHHHHHVAYRHHHSRYGRHGHYGYRDGWHGSRYRVVHDTNHRRRVTRPPDRKRHRSVVGLRESLERQRVKRHEVTRAPESRRTERRRSAQVVQRKRSEHAAQPAPQQTAKRRSATRRQPVEAGRSTERREPRRAVHQRIERGSKSASRGATLEKRGQASGSRGEQAQRAEPPRRSTKKHAVSLKKPSTRSKNPSTVKATRRSKRSSEGRSQADQEKSSTRKESTSSAREKKRARR